MLNLITTTTVLVCLRVHFFPHKYSGLSQNVSVLCKMKLQGWYYEPRAE